MKISWLILFLTIQLVTSQVDNTQYSSDNQGVKKPNYCRIKACIRCVDYGEYFGCEKCVNFDTKTLDVKKCDDMTIQDRENTKKLPNQMGSDMRYCEGAIAQIPFKRNSPNHCIMCSAGLFLLYPRNPVTHPGTKAIACVKPPNTSMIDCLVGYTFPMQETAKNRVLYTDSQDKSLTQQPQQTQEKNKDDPSMIRQRKLIFKCYVCKYGHPSKDLLECVKPRKYKDYFTRMNVKNFEKCSHGVRPAENVEGFCALCEQPVYSVVGDRLDLDFGKCIRIQDDNKGCAKRVDGKCLYCDHYRGYFMTFPNVCVKSGLIYKNTIIIMVVVSILGLFLIN